jgi:hypothetical protein
VLRIDVKRSLMKNLKKRRSRKSLSIAGDLMLAPLVVSMRLPLLASGGSTEAMLAVNEKVLAFSEGVLAAQMTLVKSTMWFWPEVLSGRTPSIFSATAAENYVHAALRPASRRVKGNFDRLTKKAG